MQDAVLAGHLKSNTYQRLMVAVIAKSTLYLTAFLLVCRVVATQVCLPNKPPCIAEQRSDKPFNPSVTTCLPVAAIAWSLCSCAFLHVV